MEFYDILRERHSVRRFTDKRVESKKVHAIVDATICAPSAGNMQSYKIYIVKSQDAKENLVPAASYQEFIGKTPLIMVFCADQKRAETKYEGRGFELYSMQDATIACTYAQLAATNEGLSSVWVGGFDPLEVSRILRLGEYEVPVAMLAIGYPAEAPRVTGRRPVSEMVKEI